MVSGVDEGPELADRLKDFRGFRRFLGGVAPRQESGGRFLLSFFGFSSGRLGALGRRGQRERESRSARCKRHRG